jgi:hypothetical protein
MVQHNVDRQQPRLAKLLGNSDGKRMLEVDPKDSGKSNLADTRLVKELVYPGNLPAQAHKRPSYWTGF